MSFIDKIKALFGFKQPEPALPTVRLQAILAEQKGKLAAGQAAARLSGDLVGRLQHERDCLAKDVQTLQHRGSDKLPIKQQELTAKTAELDAAASEHRKNISVIADYNDVINRAIAEANRLKIDLDMAKVQQESARFQSNLTNGLDNDSAADAREEIQREIRKARAIAEVNRAVTPDSKADQEYLNASEGK